MAISVSIPCSGTLLPSKADLTNIFVQLASIPSQLEAEADKLRLQLIQNVSEEVRSEILRKVEPLLKDAEKVRKILNTIESALGKYPTSVSKPVYKNLSIPDDEWERRVTAIVQEYHLYVQAKIMEEINKVIPLNVEVPILGLNINIIRIFSDPTYPSELKLQVIENVANLHPLVPEVYQAYNAQLGLDSIDQRAEAVWSYIISRLKNAALTIIYDAIGKLIDKFNTIWESLGLPALPLLLNLNVEALLQTVIGSVKAQIQNAPYEIKIRLLQELEKKLANINIAGFSLLDIIGGDIEEFVRSPEQRVHRLTEAAREFGEDYPMYLIKKYMEKIKKFLDAIGLGVLLEWATFDFCKFLKLIGVPTSISVDVNLNLNLAAGSNSVAIDTLVQEI